MDARSNDPEHSHDTVAEIKADSGQRKLILAVIHSSGQWVNAKQITGRLNRQGIGQYQQSVVARQLTTLWRERLLVRKAFARPKQRTRFHYQIGDRTQEMTVEAGWYFPEKPTHNGWSLVRNITCVMCPGCEFVMAAGHTDLDNTNHYTCPQCGYGDSVSTDGQMSLI